MKYATFLAQAGIEKTALSSGSLEARTPVDGSVLGKIVTDSAASVDAKIKAAAQAFLVWRRVPGPRRGALVSAFAQRVREQKPALTALVSLESGKILTEGAGEVQEVIDICDFAVGLSRQLHGLTIASERPGHHLLERWQPLGPVAVITAFNFPMAVWAWNAMLALVCGDSVIWKPSEKTPLCAVALHRILEEVLKDFPDAPAGLSALVQGGRELGEQLVDSPAIALLSATGSTAMGRIVGPRVAARFGRTLLELGGNNAAIIAPTADLQLALRAIVFSAVGTAGQRCTSLRRLLVHRSIHDKLVASLKQSYSKLAIGSPLENGTLVGPLIDGASFDRMQKALVRAKAEGARITGGERVKMAGMQEAYYVQPAIVEMNTQLDVALEETFAPILYVMPYDNFEDALALQNAARHGLSSAIFTNDMREAETFVSVSGSDCGIANVNTGTSGAEIGGAFGGEKETGGGRESGSDSWKSYMRRQTQTINYSTALPLAQGVSFDPMNSLDFFQVRELLSDEERLVQDTVARFVDERAIPLMRECFEQHRFPKELIPEIAGLGLLGPTIEGYGCAGMNAISSGLICQELERGDSGLRSFASVQSSLVMFPIHHFGSEAQRERYLPPMARGELIGCFGLTEAQGGSDPGAMRTRAVRKGDTWVINGAKMWITNGNIAGVCVCWAMTDEGIRGFLVDTDTPGFKAQEIENKFSLRASITSALFFDDVQVPDSQRLPTAAGLKGPLSCLTQARYGIAWGAIGAAQACLAEVLEYTGERVMFGRPLAATQMIQVRLADMARRITTAQLLALQLGKLKERGVLDPAQVSMAKWNNCRMALDIARDCRDMLGGAGISAEHGAIRHMLNLESVITYEGTETVHQLAVGRALTGHNAF